MSMLLLQSTSNHTVKTLLSSNSRQFFNLPSSFPFSSPNSSSSGSGKNGSSKLEHKPKGILKKQGNLWVYTESQEMNYSPKQLYSIIANVDEYKSFLPFATESKVLSAHKISSTSSSGSKERVNSPIQGKGWLKDLDEMKGESWELDAELRIGAMGYDEGYVSLVKAKKWESVAATAKDSTIFKQLHTEWKLSPSSSSTSDGSSPSKTKVDLYLAYQFISPFHELAVSTMWEKISGLMIIGFRKRVEQVYGKQ